MPQKLKKCQNWKKKSKTKFFVKNVCTVPKRTPKNFGPFLRIFYMPALFHCIWPKKLVKKFEKWFFFFCFKKFPYVQSVEKKRFGANFSTFCRWNCARSPGAMARSRQKSVYYKSLMLIYRWNCARSLQKSVYYINQMLIYRSDCARSPGAMAYSRQ